MNKRIMSIVLALVMLISLVAAVVPVSAAGSTSFKMSADKAEAKPGDIITYTVSIGAVEDIIGFKLKLSIPAGLTYVEGSGAAVDGLEDTMDAVKAEFTESSKVFIFGANSRTSYTSATETVLMTFQCSVNADATGDLEVTFIIDEDEVYDSDYDNISFTTTTAPVTVVVAGGHEHTWADASCMAPKTCTECGETEGDVAPHTLKHYDAVAAGCHNYGNQEYWQCTVCGGCWLDEACTMFTNVKMVIIPANAENVVHFDAVAPGCHYNGNVEYWYCPDCEGFWTDEACTKVTNSKSVILPATGGEVVHFEAIAPACHYNGRIEYWFCDECEQFWADEALTQITNSKSVILPAIGGEVNHVEAVEPTCQSAGNIEYWFCEECEQFWADEALTKITNSKSVILPAVEHANLVHMDAVAPACHYNGNIEYWFCPDCEGFWADEALTKVTNSKSVILPATGGEVVHFEAIAPACHYNGRIEYWFCDECEQFWADEALTQITNSKSVILPAIGGEVNHVEAVAPTCQSAGNIEYWFCDECEQFWADEALTRITNSKSVILPAAEHANLVHMDAVAPACHYNGNIEYWYCPDCEGFWADEALTKVTNSKSVILPATGGEVVHFEAIAPACHYNGRIEYWFCEECEQFWADEALTKITNSKSVILPAIGGEVNHVEAVAPTCQSEGNIEYWFCEECEQFWADEALTRITNSKSVKLGATDHVNLVHFDAVAPACHYNGNIEYWFCPDCEGFWANEALTQLTNSKNVILPATGGEVVHMDAVAPGCHSNGNIEYWFCAECEQFWADEALTQITNSKSVILPAKGSDKLVHFDAVAPGCHYIGNVEYWFCPECEGFWTDAACTKVTNSKSVILPAKGSDKLQHVAYKAPTATEDGNVEYWYCPVCEQFWLDEALTRLTNSKSVILPATGEQVPETGDVSIFGIVVILMVATCGAVLVISKKKFVR